MSYRTTHGDWVETLAYNLKAQSYVIFLDSWELIPGQLFPGQIHQALRHARCAILVASPSGAWQSNVTWKGISLKVGTAQRLCQGNWTAGRRSFSWWLVLKTGPKSLVVNWLGNYDNSTNATPRCA
jgi:hypothetical protein